MLISKVFDIFCDPHTARQTKKSKERPIRWRTKFQNLHGHFLHFVAFTRVQNLMPILPQIQK